MRRLLLSLAVAHGSDISAVPLLPVTTLTWDGTGDYGPHTVGTRTSGWQEALKHCAASGRDLTVQGGSDLATSGKDDAKAVYFVDEPIRIPPSQDFRIDGGTPRSPPSPPWHCT